MIRLIYFLLAALLAVGCVQQAKNTHPQNDVALIDIPLAAADDSHENTVLTEPESTDSVLTDSILTDSASANLQISEIYSDRELPSMSFKEDTVETVLSAGYAKSFLSKDKEEILKYIIMKDTMWYTGVKANVIISNHNRIDSMIITRSLLVKEIEDLEEYKIDTAQFTIYKINYLFEKNDTVCFLISLIKPDTDFDFYFKYYHTNENDYIEQDFDIWAEGESDEE